MLLCDPYVELAYTQKPRDKPLTYSPLFLEKDYLTSNALTNFFTAVTVLIMHNQKTTRICLLKSPCCIIELIFTKTPIMVGRNTIQFPGIKTLTVGVRL